eukprot:6468734-Amphidinium_carterae.4
MSVQHVGGLRFTSSGMSAQPRDFASHPVEVELSVQPRDIAFHPLESYPVEVVEVDVSGQP